MAAEAIGVVLAGGAGRRVGGDKACLELGGRPLVAWVTDALAAVVGEIVVCARAGTALPADGFPVWREPASETPPHPLAGLAVALGRSSPRTVLCCPVDLPFVSADLLMALLDAPGPVVVADGQPLLGRFGASCAPALAAAAVSGASVRATVAGLGPTVVAVRDPSVLFNVNTVEDLSVARAAVAAGGRPRPR